MLRLVWSFFAKIIWTYEISYILSWRRASSKVRIADLFIGAYSALFDHNYQLQLVEF